MLAKILLLFFLCVYSCWGNQIPSPWFVKSAATVDLPSTSADIIASTENGTHILAADSTGNLYVFVYSYNAGVQLARWAEVDAWYWRWEAGLWTHWRNALAYGIRWDPMKNIIIKMRYSGYGRNLFTWSMDGSLNYIDYDETNPDSSPFWSVPHAYPRIASFVGPDYYYVAVFNDPTIDSTNNATGFAIFQFNATNTPNADSNYLNRQMLNLTHRAFSIEFQCNNEAIVCVWTSPLTVAEYFLIDLTFRRSYTISTPITPLTFDPAIARNETNTYYFHESKFDRNQFILRSRNQTHEIANTTIPFNVSFPYRIPYYDLQISEKGVYAAATTFMNSSYGLGETEIVITKHDHSLSRLQSAVIVSTVGQDNLTRIIPLSDSFIVLGTTKGNLSSPTDEPYTSKLFALQFAPLDATLITSKPLTVMAYEVVQIQFLSIPAALQMSIPQVQFNGNDCTDVAWNGSSILAKIPEGIGGPFDLWIRFNSLIHFKPSIKFDGLVYGQPVVSSVSPAIGPSVGFNITITANNIGVPEQIQIVVSIGTSYCLNVVQIDNNTITCQVPPGTGQNHIVVVSVGPVSNSTEPFHVSYYPPAIDQILPPSGPTIGNSPIYIIGNGFGTCNPSTPSCDGSGQQISATISNKPCINVKLYNDTHVECLTPEGSGQNRTLMLQVNGQNASYPYSYQPPTVSSIIPTSILSANPTIYLEGFNFGGVNATRNVVLTDTNSSITYRCPSLIYVSHNGVRCEFSNISLPLYSTFNISIVVDGQTNSALTTPQFRTGIPNSPPTATPLNLTTLEDTSLIVEINIKDVDEGDILQAYVTSNPVYGNIFQLSSDGLQGSAINASGSAVLVTNQQRRILYVPARNFFGFDSFTVNGKDQKNAVSNTAFINITIITILDPPIPISNEIYVDEDTPVVLNLSVVDVEQTNNISITLLATPQRGILELFSLSNQSWVEITTTPVNVSRDDLVRFIPLENEYGMFYDAITFKANNGLLESLTNGTVIIHVKPVNDMPFFNRTSLNLTVLEDSPVIFKFDIKDVDALDILTVKITAIRIQGSIFLVDPAKEKSQGAPLGEGSELPYPYQMLYQPQTDFFTIGLSTTQFFNISYSDGRVTAVEEVTFTVLPINDPPRVFCSPTIDLPLSFITGASDIYQIRILATDPESDNLTYHLVRVPEKGVLYGISANGTTMQLVNGSRFYSKIIQYSANSTGGGYPFWDFAYIVEDSSQAKSDLCSSTLVFTCPIGKFNNIFRNNTGPICDTCVEGADCSPDGSEAPRPKYGFWRSESNLTYIPCTPSEACPGTAENSCAVGYTGNRCAVCSKTYYKLSNRCVPCSSDQSTFFIVLALILVTASALVIFLSRMQKDGYSFLLLGIYVNFIQTILILRDFRLNWPQEFHTILNALSFMNFNVELTSPDCYLPEAFNFSFKMKLTLALPLVLVPSVIILFLIYHFSRQLILWIIDSAKYQDQTSSILFKVIRVFHMLIILLYTSVTSSSLALFDCTKEADGFYYLDIDPSIRCYTDSWYQDVPFAIAAVIVYVIGIPAYFFIIYYLQYQSRAKGSIFRTLKTICSKIVAVEHQYKSDYQFFMVIQLFQKLCLVATGMFFTRYKGLQTVVTVSLLSVTLEVYRKFKPYKQEILNTAEIMSVLSSILILALGLAFLDDISNAIRSGLTIVILAIIAGFTLFIAVVSIHLIKERIKIAFNSRARAPSTNKARGQVDLLHT